MFVVQVLYPGGETEALDRMRRYLSDKQWVGAFQKASGCGGMLWVYEFVPRSIDPPN